MKKTGAAPSVLLAKPADDAGAAEGGGAAAVAPKAFSAKVVPVIPACVILFSSDACAGREEKEARAA